MCGRLQTPDKCQRGSAYSIVRGQTLPQDVAAVLVSAVVQKGERDRGERVLPKCSRCGKEEEEVIRDDK